MTGLEKLKEALDLNPGWTLGLESMTPDGDMIVYYYNNNSDVTCKCRYIKDMDQEYYLDSMIFVNGKEFEV